MAAFRESAPGACFSLALPCGCPPPDWQKSLPDGLILAMLQRAFRRCCRGGVIIGMEPVRMTIWYSGRVQGVGFRMTCRQVATGYEVTGVVRNLPDGRVELVAEGSRQELEAFQEGIRESGLRGFIRDEQVDWCASSGEYRGFEIGRW